MIHENQNLLEKRYQQYNIPIKQLLADIVNKIDEIIDILHSRIVANKVIIFSKVIFGVIRGKELSPIIMKKQMT